MRNRHHRVAAAAVGVAAALALSACSEAGQPSPPPTPGPQPDDVTTSPETETSATSSPPDDIAPTTAPPDTEPTTSPPDATTAPPDADAERPVMPEVANEQSAEGAEAYTVHYLETVAWLAHRPEAGGLDSFAVSDNCDRCTAFRDLNEEQVAADTRFEAPLFTVSAASSAADDTGASITVDIEQPALNEIDSAGNVVYTEAPVEIRAGVDLVWNGGWVIDYIYTVE